jgi:CubicO group peptidase (beta-lactamase class C family)
MLNSLRFNKVIIFLIFTTFNSLSLYAQENKATVPNLHLAVLQGNLDAVNQNIEAGTDLNKKDQFGSTPLIVAATFGKTEIAKALINAGADLNIADKNESTPLIIASFLGRTQIVKLLIDKGADKYVRNNDGSTAFDIVSSPFEYDKETYDKISAGLRPLGLVLDYEKIKKARPVIAEMLRPKTAELESVNYNPPIRSDWKTSTPGEQKINPVLVAELYNDASHLETLYGLLVIKNGYLVAEDYFNGASIEQLSRRASVTKSFVSAMIGIALDKGYINNLDEKMVDYFPEIANKITDQRKKSITIKEMLQMRAGYPWEETDTLYWNAMWSGEYISKIVSVPLTLNPGTGFQYSNLTSNWLAIIATRASDMDLRSFGEKYLFSTLGIRLGNWNRDLDGYYIGCADLEVTARDMAKFGLLYLNDGMYEGKNLIPAKWINESFHRYSENINSVGIKDGKLGRYIHDIGYGYQWWSGKIGDHQFNFAWGHGGQLIIILKDMNMVIVTTADPFYGKEKHFKAWRYEKSIINVIGKFVQTMD